MKPYYETDLGKLYHGDCLEIMPELEPVDLVLTDPPYNISQKNKRTKIRDKIISNYEAWGEWDNFDNKEFDDFMFNFLAITWGLLVDGGILYCFTARGKNGFYCDYACNRIGFKYQNTIAIIKDNPLPHFTKTNYRSAFELAFYVSKEKPKIFNFISQQEMINKIHYVIGQKHTTHPTEKPIKAFQLFIQVSSNKGGLILDPFFGSGTTAIVSERLDRRWIGIEKSEEYCEIAAKRIENERKQLKMF